MKESLCRLKTKEELKKDIQSKMVELYQERQKISVEYREKVKKIDIELSELDYKLMSGKY
jgi:ribosomal protein L29